MSEMLDLCYLGKTRLDLYGHGLLVLTKCKSKIRVVQEQRTRISHVALRA